MSTFIKPLKSHHGKNISKIRSLRSIKQEVLATELGMTQSEISHVEQLEEIKESLLERIAAALNVTADIIKNFDEGAALYIINNNMVEKNTSYESSPANKQGFSPILKIVELYERLLQSEKEKLEILQQIQKRK